MGTPAAMVAADHEQGDQIIMVQHETILMTVGDSTVDGIGTTVAELEDGATPGVLPEIIHLHELPAALAVDSSDAMPIIDFRVSSDPIYNIGDTRELLDNAAGHELGLPAREIGGQPGAFIVDFILAAVDNHGPVARIDVHAILPGELLPRRDNFQGELPEAEADVEGIFSITLSPEYRRVDVDLGWGIVVGGLSQDDFNEILAFPAFLE